MALAPAGLSQSPTSAESPRQAALALEQQGRSAEAEEAWQAYTKTHPSSSEAYAHLGLLEARQQHYPEAVPMYRKAIALGATNPTLQLDLGLALFKMGKTRQALAEFEPLVPRAPAASPVRKQLVLLVGMCHYGLGQYKDAAVYLKEASANDPGNLPLLLALAHSDLWSKQYQQVLDTYRQILLLNANSAEADMLAGEALDELKNTSGAIEQFRAAVKADPHMPDVHFGLGYLLWTKQQYPEAGQEFRAELENNPNHAQALTYLGDAELAQGHADIARPLLDKAVALNPRLGLAHLDLGTIEADAGHQQQALQELTSAARLEPRDVNVHWRLGRLYRAMGKRDQARVEFEKARTITQTADTALVNKLNPPAK